MGEIKRKTGKRIHMEGARRNKEERSCAGMLMEI